MINKFKHALIVAGTVLLSGCATQTFMVHPQANSKLSNEKMQTFFINGLGQEQVTNADRICGGGDKVVKIQAKQTFVDGLLSYLTGGIFTPRTVKVYCKR